MSAQIGGRPNTDGLRAAKKEKERDAGENHHMAHPIFSQCPGRSFSMASSAAYRTVPLHLKKHVISLKSSHSYSTVMAPAAASLAKPTRAAQTGSSYEE